MNRIRQGRALHLLDLENLGRGPQCAGDWLARVVDRFGRVAEWAPHDHAIGAASTWCYKRVCFDLPSLRLLPAGGGADAADRRLINEAEPAWTAEHFDRVVVGSGDGIFAGLVDELKGLGAVTWAIAWRSAMSPRLARAVDVVRYLDDDETVIDLRAA